jgi:hypothetical protein
MPIPNGVKSLASGVGKVAGGIGRGVRAVTPGRTHFDVDPDALEELATNAQRELTELLAEWDALTATHPRVSELVEAIDAAHTRVTMIEAARCEAN